MNFGDHSFAQLLKSECEKMSDDDDDDDDVLIASAAILFQVYWKFVYFGNDEFGSGQAFKQRRNTA